MNTFVRFQFLALFILVVSFTTFAFASSQTGQPMGGEGAGIISGWDVTGVHYLTGGDPSYLAGVEFDLNGPADVVKVSLSAGSRFYDCTNVAGYHWVCNVNSVVRVADISELKVVATGAK